jgi:hypothetical protein
LAAVGRLIKVTAKSPKAGFQDAELSKAVSSAVYVHYPIH